ncbi:hypothetical protein [Advenella mimigardefordensis]|uniref:Uncharacterized protein n=1 Tax=Advenella mimigardefordensis (strain DSM 17166 / LMG 22922 / DPN7) TaxID=1247726 RepID=W0PCV9_ADVMD|nr:hypothetical protein [Advenella mimigardefordensis]AHG62873.1 hypothetical protein MIM_c07740 [Advenella mimigardefordensis DPN7]
MIVTIAFEVKNYVEVMESWPIKIGNTTFFLDRDGDVVKKVCLSYANVGIENAPTFTNSPEIGARAKINISCGEYSMLAIQQILSWQAVVSGVQVFDLDLDNYELRFRPESIEEQKKIPIKSFRHSRDNAQGSTCDFEQIGRAFCVGHIEDSRIESVSHYREGRLAYKAGRYIDSYNNMFLFLESRYCDGKTKTGQQVELLSSNKIVCESLKDTISDMRNLDVATSKHLHGVFENKGNLRESIHTLVLLRGKLRHHSLKSPQRWDPNKQNEYEMPARFLGAVVGYITSTESLNEIYAPEPVKQFRDISVNSGFETKIRVLTNRLEYKPSLELSLSYPTIFMSSQVSLNAVRRAIDSCDNGSQLADTVKLEAIHSQTDLEVFIVELGLWAYTKSRILSAETAVNHIRCSFEHFHASTVVKHEFSFLIEEKQINIACAWRLLIDCFDWIEKKDPTTRILSLKFFLNSERRPIVSYRVGAQIKK